MNNSCLRLFSRYRYNSDTNAKRSVGNRLSSSGRPFQKSGFSLAELIMAIVLLSVFGIIVARMYFVSDRVARKTAAFDQAILLSADLAEQWQAVSSGKPDLPVPVIIDGQAVNGSDWRDFTENRTNGRSWSFTQEKTGYTADSVFSGKIELVLNETASAGVWQLKVTVFPDQSSAQADEPLYELVAGRYFPQEVLP